MTITADTDLPFEAAVKQFRFEYWQRRIRQAHVNIYDVANLAKVARTTAISQINKLGLKDELHKAREGARG
jgi:hypothetical protein